MDHRREPQSVKCSAVFSDIVMYIAYKQKQQHNNSYKFSSQYKYISYHRSSSLTFSYFSSYFMLKRNRFLHYTIRQLHRSYNFSYVLFYYCSIIYNNINVIYLFLLIKILQSLTLFYFLRQVRIFTLSFFNSKNDPEWDHSGSFLAYYHMHYMKIFILSGNLSHDVSAYADNLVACFFNCETQYIVIYRF